MTTHDRYYQLGSHDKLFNQIDELTDALASRDTEIAEMTKYANKRNTAALDAEAQIAQLCEQVNLYEQALLASWPNGAMGDAFELWNAARKLAATEPK